MSRTRTDPLPEDWRPAFQPARPATVIELQPPAMSPAMVDESRTVTPRLFEAELVFRVRDLAEERYATTGDSEWSTLAEVTEQMIAGQRDESEIGSWIDQYNLSDELGFEPRREP